MKAQAPMICGRCAFENAPDAKACGRCGAALPSPSDPASTQALRLPLRELASGTTFARRYQVIEELGRGGMGRVYKVFDTEVREKLALKLIHPDVAADEGTIERFRNELRLARTVSHRNICRMHDLGREEGSGTYYITMEYVPGEDLKSLIHSIGALPVAKAAAVARQAAEGLAEAHRRGVVHRDLKPQNIMIDREGGARVMDFGVARSVKAKGLTGAGAIVGTPEYMSPEQVDGREADARSDIYALGVVLFEMLTGRLPFEGGTPLAVAVKQKSEPAPDPRTLNAQVPEALAAAVLKCLDKDQAKRFASADELVAELAKIEKTLPETAGPLPLRKPATSKTLTVRLPSRRVWIPAAAVLLALLALLVWQLVPEGEGAKRTVAVLGFRNQTGDPGLDYLRETIPNLLITSLEQSRHLRVSSWQRLRDLVRQSGKDETALYDEDVGLDVCRREGIEAVVVGFFSKAGNTFVSDVKVLDVGSREVLKSATARGEGMDSILRSQVDEISRAVARGVGRPALKLDRAPARIIDLTTNSLEAYSYFLRGRDEVENLMAAEAKGLLKKAIALDPDFAVAYLYLARAEFILVDFNGRDSSLRRAKELSARASEKERLYIEAEYARGIEGDAARANRLLLELADKYPQEKYAHYEIGRHFYQAARYIEAVRAMEAAVALDPTFGPAFNMLGYAHGKAGDFARAEEVLDRYAALHPGDPNPIDSQAELYLRMGLLDKAEAKYREALALRSDFSSPSRGLFYIFALREDYGEARRWLEDYIARSGAEEKLAGLWLVHYLDYFLGRREKARRGFEGLRRTLESIGSPPYFVATVDWSFGFIDCDMGSFDEARTAFRAYLDYLRQANPAVPSIIAAVDSLYAGWADFKQKRWDGVRARLAEVRRLLPRLDRESANMTSPYSQETASIFFLAELLEAEAALAEGSPDEGLAAARRVRLLSFAGINPPDIAGYNTPFLKDVLARAYWKKGDRESAAAEYRKLMTLAPSDQVRYLIPPLYHYRLGRVLEESGDAAGAAAEYRKFLEYWKDADPAHPELEDARRRLAALDGPPR